MPKITAITVIVMIIGALGYALSGGKTTEDKAVAEPSLTARDEAAKAKKEMMREIGRKGGKASAAKRKAKKAAKKVETDDVQP